MNICGKCGKTTARPNLKLMFFYSALASSVLAALCLSLYLATGSKYYDPESFISASVSIFFVVFLVTVMDDQI
jgi:uncharacterized membrane protein